MYSVGEHVVYATHGVCIISDISVMSFGNCDKEYYILSPMTDKKSTFYVPVDSAALVSQMRPILSLDEINSLISSLQNETLDWIVSDQKRKAFCLEIIKSGDRLQMMNMIRMLYSKQQELISQKKHFHVADEKLLKDAEKLIHEEFSFVLGITVGEVPGYIEQQLKATS